jgi:hypothetical protein
MKIIEKEDNYSLHNLENFKNNLNVSTEEIVKTYKEIIHDFLKFILENLKIKTNMYSKFIIIRGVDTITNVFNIILYYTKNLELTFYHCQKSYYYYVEFIEQISEDQHVFLQLNSRDASTYVFKKTIYELKHDIVKNITFCSDENKIKLDSVNEYIYFLKNTLELIFQKIDLEYDNLEKKIEIIKKIHVIFNVISLLKLDKKTSKILYYFFEKITILEKEIDIDLYLEILFVIMRKIIKNTNKSIQNIEKNILNYDRAIMKLDSNYNIDKFIKIFISN